MKVQTYKTNIILENEAEDISGIQTKLIIEYTYYPGKKEIPARRDKNGSILSYQSIGSSEEPAELEIINSEINWVELQLDIVKTIKNNKRKSSDLFLLFGYLGEICLFEINCIYDRHGLQIVETEKDVIMDIMDNIELEYFLLDLQEEK